MNFLIGFLLSVLVAGLAYYKHALNVSGFLSASVVGTLIYGFGTYVIFALLMLFFITSSIFTKNKVKSRGRNGIQVIVNSGMALIFSLAYYISNHEFFLLISATSIAVSTADTWASELGKYSKGSTVSIINFKKIDKGQSGGISVLGTVASLLGGLLIAVSFLLMTWNSFSIIPWYLTILFIMLGGFVGSVVDSILGILIQEKYMNLKTNQITEVFDNKSQYRLISGIKYINNDMVNLLTSVIVTCASTLFLL
ncbi:conserved hypothetical protein [Alteracholeplasma palmae J233]|uniref:Integral membrane protein n=1 Tax=Alteracholeplasma palmae (strain ATCC 49389 / J233) TaxID=1318466 RepID=U4KLE2_ALTPJ|nr:DUF92 domain-containing protein [Alteracholeplasma palmae]CCV64628.1 conserved hypothetical protein [Alteracholeplasma palmae J233]